MMTTSTDTPRLYSYIRFSTKKQRKGDSYRRQLEAAKAYALEHRLVLDEKLKMEDIGFSGYKGDHRKRGSLGVFLKLLEEGRVPSGSVLLVESLDRLSRERTTDAFEIFHGILKRGVKVVVTSLGQMREYTEDSINNNPNQLHELIGEMTRAFQESEWKSKRLKSAWKEKRKNIDKKKLTKRCPAWLKLNKNRTEYEVIPDAVEVVRQIYAMKLDGLGKDSIAKKLNELGVWSPKNGWRGSYVQKILISPAVIGEYQPHKMVKNKRVSIGDSISGYYPQVVDKDQFNQVRSLMNKNKGKGGRTGKVSNLFTGLIKCGYCGSPMAFVDKGNPPKGQKYLVCDAARRGLGCCQLPIHYAEIEIGVLSYCVDLEAVNIMPNDSSRARQIAILRQKIQTNEGQIIAIKKEIEGLLQQTKAEGLTDRVRLILNSELDTSIKNKDDLESDIELDTNDLNSLLTSKKDSERQIDNVKNLFQKMNNLEGDERINLRKKLRLCLRELINKIIVCPIGYVPCRQKESLKNAIDRFVEGPACNDLRRKYTVFFNAGGYQTLSPLIYGDKLSVIVEADKDGKSTSIDVDSQGNWDVDFTLSVEEEKRIAARRKQVNKKQREDERCVAKNKAAQKSKENKCAELNQIQH